MQRCSRGTRSLRINQLCVENNASVRALIAMQHAPCTMRRGQTVCRILWQASDGRANQLIRLHRAGFVFLLLVRPREGVPWANEEHARCKPTASGDPSVDLWMELSRCCQSLGCHLSRAGRHHEKRFVKSPAHLQAMPCVWLA